MTVKRIKFKFVQIKAWTSGCCLIERKLNSLEVCQARSRGRWGQWQGWQGWWRHRHHRRGWRDQRKGGRVHQPERTLHLECIMNVLLKARTLWPRLKERKFYCLKRGEVVQVVVIIFGVVGLRRVDEEQAGSPETSLLFKVVQVIVVCGVVLAGVNEEQAKLQRNKRDRLNSWKTLKSLLDLWRQLLYSNEGLILLNDG